MPTDHLPLSDAGPAVRDAMLLEPRATPASATLTQAREAFANPHVKLLLVVADDGRFAGTLTREDLPAEGDGTVGEHVNADAPRISPDAPVAQAVEMLDGAGDARLPVVEDGRLLGLVCWDANGQQFCVDPGRVTKR
jgi:CBS domain-containing protein